jgi:hypothetical protein
MTPTLQDLTKRHEARRVALLSQTPPVNATTVFGLATEAHADCATLLDALEGMWEAMETARIELAGLLRNPNIFARGAWPREMNDGDEDCLRKAYEALHTFKQKDTRP